MTADHILHGRPGAEGYMAWRLECIPDCGYDHHGYSERDWPDDRSCRCTEQGNECEECAAGEHDFCGWFDASLVDVNAECRAEVHDECVVHAWLDNEGRSLIHGDDWPEDGPWPVRVTWPGDYPEIHYAGDVAS